MTVHETEECCYVVLVNYSHEEQWTQLTVKDCYELAACYGAAGCSGQKLPAHEAVVLTIRKRG